MKYSLRFCLTINVKEDPKSDPNEAYIKKFKEWIEKVMLKADEGAIIAPWNTVDMTRCPAIISSQSCPSSVDKLHPYFKGGLKPKWGSVWAEIHLFTDEPTHNFTSHNTNSAWWWYDQGGQTYLDKHKGYSTQRRCKGQMML